MSDTGKAIDDLAFEIAHANEEKGFWDKQDPEWQIPRKLSLIHSEVSEALDAQRARYGDGPDNKSTGMTDDQERDFTEELADAMIRIMDLAGYYELPVGPSIISKLRKNAKRPPKHGKRY